MLTGKQLGFAIEDELYIYDCHLQTLVQQDAGMEFASAVPTGPGTYAAINGDTMYEINFNNLERRVIKRFKNKIQFSLPGFTNSCCVIADDEGQVSVFPLDMAIYFACFKQLKINLIKNPVALEISRKRDKYQTFSYLIKKFIFELEEQNHKEKSQQNMLIACVKINELIKIIQRAKPNENIKKCVSDAIEQELSSYVAKRE